MKNNLLKILVVGMAAAMMLASCGNSASSTSSTEESSTSASSEESSETPEESSEDASAEVVEEKGLTMYYPEDMVETYGETLELEEYPEKIVALSNAAMQVMVRCDVHPIAVTSTSTNVEYPDWIKELPVISTGMNQVDVESIIALEPDLVIMGSYLREDYGSVLEADNIPVYYTTEGPSVDYTHVKNEAIALTKSFGSEEDVASVEKDFSDVEERAAKFTAAMEAKDMMILFSYPPSYQQTSMGYLGSMLKLMPFNNLSDELIGADSRTAPLDMEKLVELNPEVLFAISPMSASADDLKASYEEEFANNSAIWDNLQAKANDNIIYLSGEYVTSKGLHIVNSMNNLMDELEAKFGVTE